MLRAILSATALIAAPAAANLPAAVPDDAELNVLLEKHDVPGLSYAQLHDCKIVATRTAGLAIVEELAPVDGSTLFEAASLSKPVFTWLVMDLERSGVIDLDRPFADYGFDWPRVADKARYAELTPRLVLTHRTGLPNWSGDPKYPARTDALEFQADPDTDHTYSGEAFQLLQGFVEQMAGKSLNALFRERLGHTMPHSSFNDNFQPNTKVSRGYTSADDPADARDIMPEKEVELAAASLATTASDYASFMQMVCKRDGLSAASYAEMLRPQTAELPSGEGMPIRWALGWPIAIIDGRELVMHTGSNGKYRAFAGFYPDTGEGFVMLTNGENGEQLIDDFLDLSEDEEEGDAQEVE